MLLRWEPCFCQKEVHAEFVERLTALTRARKVGNPMDLETDQGPQVDKAQFDKIMSYIEKGKSEGANCVSGGERSGDKGYFIQPTVFDNVTDSMAIAQDEIFGPVMSVLSFEVMGEDLIQRANNTFYGLAAAVWTKDLARALNFAKRVRAGNRLGQLL